jgi:photosystem II stability/assembly factor-like uncharacterized protein
MKAWSNILFIALLISPDLSSQWVKTNGQFNSRVFALATYGANIFAGIESGGLFRSTDGGMTWDSIYNGLTSPSIKSLAISDDYIYAGSWDAGIFVSGNNGTNWYQTGLNYYTIEVISIQDTNIFAGTWGNGIFLSTDKGISWQPRSEGISTAKIMSIDIKDDRIAASAYGAFNPNEYPIIFYSSNNGVDWNTIITGLPGSIVKDVAFSGTSIYAAVNDYSGIYRSTDNGQLWMLHNNGFPQKLPHKLIKYNDKTNNCYLFAGCYSGQFQGVIYMNKNDESSWHNISGELPDNGVWSLAVSDQYLLAGIGNDVWLRSMSEIVSSVGQSIDLPENFRLEQNYPNPFNPSTLIKYSLPRQSRITIIIYDALGKEITRLVDEEKPAGEYSIEFNATDLASGLYVYRIQGEGFIDSRKMLLIK